MDHHHQRFERNTTNGYDVMNEIKAQVAIVTCANGGGRAHQEERVAIRGCGNDGRDSDRTSRTGTVFNNERLAEPIRQPFTDQARKNIGRPARGKPDDDADRSRWIIERRRRARCDRQYGGRQQFAKSSAGSSHGDPGANIETPGEL